MIAVPTIAGAGGTSRPGCAVVVLEEHGRPSAVLRHAADLARALGLDLHTLRVLRRHVGQRVHPLVGSGRSGCLDRLSLARGTDAAWCDEILGAGGAEVHLCMGDFSGQVIAFARRSRAKVVIVPPREGKHGDRVTALARACECPILVLRTPPGFQTLIAATDLEHQEFPVLRVAAELAARLDARVLALHNARPVTSAQRPEATFSTAIRLRSGTGLLREARSNDAASDRVVMVDGLVSNRPDTVDVILRQSRANAPALVVVGTRARQGAVRPIFGGVAARVVDGCHSSVLVTPVQDGTHHGDQTPMATRFDEA